MRNQDEAASDYFDRVYKDDPRVKVINKTLADLDARLTRLEEVQLVGWPGTKAPNEGATADLVSAQTTKIRNIQQ